LSTATDRPIKRQARLSWWSYPRSQPWLSAVPWRSHGQHAVEAAVVASRPGSRTGVGGGGNPYVYPDNLPRVNARGRPEGRPGCWQDITRDLWPAPYLVMDTGASIAPYNHAELGRRCSLITSGAARSGRTPSTPDG
jgi:hypothetical protein